MTPVILSGWIARPSIFKSSATSRSSTASVACSYSSSEGIQLIVSKLTYAPTS